MSSALTRRAKGGWYPASATKESACVQVQGQRVQGGWARVAAAQDQRQAQQTPDGEGGQQEDARELERRDDDAHQVEGGPLDLDPGNGVLRIHRPRTFSATVERAPEPVNCRIWVRFRASR